MGELPNAGQLAEFSNVLSKCRDLPSNFTRDVIMKSPHPGPDELADPAAC